MKPRNYPNKLKIFVAILIVIFLSGIGLAVAEGFTYVSANLTGFLPLLMKNSSTETSSPSSALIVFSSAATTDGNAGGRAGMNQICLVEDSTTHFCSRQEIDTAFATRGVLFQSPFYRAWLDSVYIGREVTDDILAYGQPAHADWSLHGTCLGWSSNAYSATDYAGYIEDNAYDLGQANGDVCSLQYHVACCK